MIDPLQNLVEQLENEASLFQPHELRKRLDALDRLDAFLPLQPAIGARAELHQRARALSTRLEAINCELCTSIRSAIRSGAGPESLLRWVHSPESGEGVGIARGMGYDSLDELISGVLQLEEPDSERTPREAEMVFYQPTPARHIFALMELTALTPTDVVVDLGSGLGHVPLLVSICTGARSVGIELEASYVERALQCAEDLNLNRVNFLQQDAREADLSSGTVFYLYTPFAGSILRRVLDRLRREAATRRIRICTYGPCTSVVAEELWLESALAPEVDRITVLRSRD